MSAFRLDIHDAAGTLLNHTIYISGVSIASRASRIGELRFDVPRLVALDRGIQAGRIYKLYHRVDGLYGTFYHSTDELDESGDLMTVTCHDQLIELARRTVGFNWAFSNVAFPTAMNSIASRFGGGWSAATAHNSGDFYALSYDSAGESYFQLLEVARRTQAGWFALGGDKQIKYGRWLDAMLTGDIAARLVSKATPERHQIASGGNVLITALSVQESSSDVVNRVIAVGQGLGVAQLSLFYSDLTAPYTVQNRANWDGGNSSGSNSAAALTREYYIEDAASIAAYGVREATVHFDVKPVTNSRADLLNAGNALYTISTAYLLRSRYPLKNYRLSCVGLPKAVAPGSVIEIDYRDAAVVLDANRQPVRKIKLFLDKLRVFVAEVSRSFNAAGGVDESVLTVSTTGETFADAAEIMTDLVRDAKRFRLRPVPSITMRTKAGDTLAISPSLNYNYRLKFGPDVLEINSCKLEFHLMKMRAHSSNSTGASSTTTTSGGGGQTVTTTSASGGSSAQTTNSAGDPTSLDYQYSSSIGYANSLGFTSAGISAALATDSASFGGNTGGIAYGTAGAQHGHYNAENSHAHYYVAHAHKFFLPAHSHGFSIPNHTHGVTITISSHTHDFAHTHPVEWGVYEDSVSPAGVSVWLDGSQITPIKNLSTGQFAGNNVDGEGWFYVDFINALQAMNDWRGVRSVEIRCAQGRGVVFATSDERLTIQPIAVTGD